MIIKVPIDKEFYQAAISNDIEFEYETDTTEVLDKMNTQDILDYLDNYDLKNELVNRGYTVEKVGVEVVEKVYEGSLYDKMKDELLAEASKLYTIDELQILLHWEQGSGMKKINLRKFLF